MKIPAKINFDFDTGAVLAKGVAHIPKIYQGAPYTQEIGVKNAVTGQYRDFSVYDDIVMYVKASQAAGAPMLSASKNAGTIVVTHKGFRFALTAAQTESVSLPANIRPGIIAEVPIVHDIELLQGGVVVERFAQGSGFVVVNTTRGANVPAS